MATTIRIDPILPKRHNYPMDIVDKLEREIENTLRGSIQSTLVRAFFRRTANWKTKINISGKFSRRAYKGNLTGFSLTVGPFGRNKRIWIFVSGGTKAHPESPKRAGGYMTIRGGIHGYRPRTLPGDYYGGPGDYDAASTFKTRRTIHHPGIEARNFEKHIADEYEEEIVKLIKAARDRALK